MSDRYPDRYSSWLLLRITAFDVVKDVWWMHPRQEELPTLRRGRLGDRLLAARPTGIRLATLLAFLSAEPPDGYGWCLLGPTLVLPGRPIHSPTRPVKTLMAPRSQIHPNGSSNDPRAGRAGADAKEARVGCERGQEAEE